MFRQYSYFSFLAFLLLSITGLSGIALADPTVTATRELPDKYQPNGEVTVTLNIHVSGSPRIGIGIDEYVPYGWKLKTTSHQPSDLEDGDWICWEFAPVADNYTITYTLTVPSDESGPQAFSGDVTLVYTVEPEFVFIVTEGDSLILGPDDGDVTATRYAPDTYKLNQPFNVNITLESVNAPGSVTIVETFDANVFTPGVISHQGQYLGAQNGRGTIRWNLGIYAPPMELVYALTPTSTGAGPSYFDGNWEVGTSATGPIEGDQQIVPYQEDQPDPDPLKKSCVRTFLATPKIYKPGVPFEVKLDVTMDVNVFILTVIDRFPDGWTLDLNSIEPTGGTPVGRTITWVFNGGMGTQTLRYTVTPPLDAVGNYVFSGVYAYKERAIDPFYYYSTTGDYIVGDGVTDAVPAYIPILRDLPNGYVPTEPIQVTLAYDINEASPPTELTINETIPKDWTFISANPPVASSSTRTLKWNFKANPVMDGVIQYSLLVPFDAFEKQIFTGTFTATSGTVPITGPILGDSTLGCLTCACPIFYDEGGIPTVVEEFELLNLLTRIQAGTAKPLDLFCFQRQWYDVSVQILPTPTPTQGPQ